MKHKFLTSTMFLALLSINCNAEGFDAYYTTKNDFLGSTISNSNICIDFFQIYNIEGKKKKDGNFLVSKTKGSITREYYVKVTENNQTKFSNYKNLLDILNPHFDIEKIKKPIKQIRAIHNSKVNISIIDSEYRCVQR